MSKFHREEKFHFKINRKLWAKMTILNSFKVKNAKTKLVEMQQ